MFFKRLGTILFVLIGTAGCAKSTKVVNSNNVPVTPEQALQGLSAHDTLHAKFDEAVLKCQANLFSQKNPSGLSVNDTGTDEANWDLIGDFADTKTITLHPQAANSGATVRIQIEKVEILRNQTVQDDAGTYQMDYTPVIVATYQYQSDADGTAINLSGHGTRSIYEIVQSNLTNASATDPSNSSRLALATNCYIESSVKPAYRHQYKRVH